MDSDNNRKTECQPINNVNNTRQVNPTFKLKNNSKIDTDSS